ncbi:MAG: hypothetical protein ABIA93_00045 [Candidatus Woesearchaeota archaeon]
MDPERGRKKKWPLLIIIAIIVIIIILHLIRFTESTVESIATNETVPVLGYHETTQEVCGPHNYSYTDTWAGWGDAPQEMVNPVLVLTNNEDESGTFNIEFGFLDDEQTPYDTYRELLTFKDAKFYSTRVTRTIGAGESINVTIPTKKADSSKNYWVIGNIETPQITDCRDTVVREPYNTTEQKTTYKEVPVKTSISLFRKMFGFSLW